MKRNIIILALLLLSMSLSVVAQSPYKHGIGGQISPGLTGVSYKTFPRYNFGIQVEFGGEVVGLLKNAIAVQGNLMYQVQVGEKKNLGIIIGGGASTGLNMGFYDFRGDFNKDLGFLFGFNAIIGLEITLNKIPLTIQIDTRPGLTYTTSSYLGFYGVYDLSFFNLSLRYTIK